MGMRVDTQHQKFPWGGNTQNTRIEAKLSHLLKISETWESLPFAHPETRERIYDEYLGRDDDTEWIGGTVKQLKDSLKGKMKMASFKAAEEKFKNTDIGKKLVTATTQLQTKRTRRFCDQDGEWSYDRRWEMTPFQKAIKTHQPHQTLHIRVHFGMSGAVKPETINEFGACMWALTDLIEKTGFKVKITYVKQNQNSMPGGDSEMEILLKDYGQYLAPSLLAACFTSNFYRRIMFTMITLCADAAGKLPHKGLGNPVGYDKRIEFENGEINIYPAMIYAGMTGWGTDAETALLAALGKTP